MIPSEYMYLHISCKFIFVDFLEVLNNNNKKEIAFSFVKRAVFSMNSYDAGFVVWDTSI